VTSVAALVARRIEEIGAVPFVVRDVFGDPDAIAPALEAFCLAHLGSGIRRGVFFDASVGAVHGVELLDGRRVVVKAHPPEASTSFLEAVQTVQRHLAGVGFPCPQPLVGPSALAKGLAVAEAMLDRGEVPDGRAAGVRALLARGLALLIDECRGFVDLAGFGAHPMAVADGDLWPTPHDRRFDFESTTIGAEWIDALAERAAAARDAEKWPLVIGHSDWRVQHVRVADGELAAVYDWDSLMLMSEPQAVGSAAFGYPMNWANGQTDLPTLEEATGFIRDYEAARGEPFTSGELRAVRGSLVYSMAYASRCGHSDVLTDYGRRDADEAAIERPPYRAGTSMAFLAAHADELLA
jgi:hypothetical protein